MFGNNNEEIRFLRAEVAALRDSLRTVASNQSVVTGEYESGFAPCETYHAIDIKNKFEQLYKFLGVELKYEGQKLIKKNQNKSHEHKTTRQKS